MHRVSISNASRIVVKLGTGVLTDSRKQPDLAQMGQLVSQMAAARARGKEIVIVSSGAVGAGMGVLGYEKRPSELSELQACAAVGQPRLMAIYEKLFNEAGFHAAQVLLTHDDLEHHERHLNARNTLVTLLSRGVIPIINENDAISFTELKFGDNDRLSALVACLLPADALIVLTTVEGLIENFGKPEAKVVGTVENLDADIEKMASGTSSETAVGGMSSKLQSARIVVRAGIPMVIASGKRKDVILSVLAGEEVGTMFVAQPAKLRGRKRWIAFFHHTKGTIYVDEGAKKALRDKGKSLLAPGIARCEGEFAAGEVVRICDGDGTEFARGISDVESGLLKTRQAGDVVVHRDNLVIL
jgi:glutamate 5-kinase